MKKYSLEFNEKQQMWHYNNGNYDQKAMGWETILKSATQLEMETFELYVRSKNEKKYTVEMVKQLALEFKSFIIELDKNGLGITHKR